MHGNDHLAQIADEVLLARPDTALFRRAETALVIGIDRNIVHGEIMAGIDESIAVIVEAMHRHNHRFRLAVILRQPIAHRQGFAAARKQGVVDDLRHGIRRHEMLHARCAAAGNQQQACQQ